MLEPGRFESEEIEAMNIDCILYMHHDIIHTAKKNCPHQKTEQEQIYLRTK